MSFGFSIGEFIAVMNLAWKLHQDWYKVLQDCPQEIKDLSRDLATVYGVLKHIQEDLESTNSSIKGHGENRQTLLQTMVTNLNTTLGSLQQLVLSFKPLAVEGAMRSQLRSKLKWLASQKKITRIHHDMVFHISAFNLILASMGNSSLQRIESGLQHMLLSPTQADELASEISNQDSILEPREDVSSVPFHTERSEPPQKQESEAAQSRNPTSIAPPQHLEAVAQTPSIYQAPGACDVVWRLNALNLRQQEEIANLIILNCQMACFEFYTAEALWRTKFSKDTYAGPKLFDCQDGSSAKYHTDFSLREWISKVRHAWGLRVNDQDTCRYLAIFNGKDFYDTMSDAGRIPSVLLPWGGVDTDYCGPALEVAIRFHEHLKSCDSQARLKRLLTLVRKPSGDINFTYLHPTPKATPVDMREDYIVASQSK